MTRGAEIWCLRHGESSNLVAGQAGALPCATLTRAGREQAAAAAATLATLRRPPTRVYASTAVRAMQTADVLVSCLALPEPLIPVNGLVEVGIGGREGDTDGPIHDETAEVLRTWVVHGGLEARVAAGENGYQVVARVTNALRTIAAENQGEVVALVGHVASLTAGLSALCGIGEEIWGRPLQPAVPFRVLTDGLAWRCLEWPG